MPYKDSQRKSEWERQHRSQRLARRRELRHIADVKKETQPQAFRVHDSAPSLLWVPLVAGGALASYDPNLATGAGLLILLVATVYKKNWNWWIVGLIVLAMGLFFQWSDEDGGK
jgi:hypothetical protein